MNKSFVFILIVLFSVSVFSFLDKSYFVIEDLNGLNATDVNSLINQNTYGSFDFNSVYLGGGSGDLSQADANAWFWKQTDLNSILQISDFNNSMINLGENQNWNLDTNIFTADIMSSDDNSFLIDLTLNFNDVLDVNNFDANKVIITTSSNDLNSLIINRTNTAEVGTGIIVTHDLSPFVGTEYAYMVIDYLNNPVMTISSKGNIAIGTGAELFDYKLMVRGAGTQFIFQDTLANTVVQMADNAITFNQDTTINAELLVNGNPLTFNSSGSIVIDSKNVLTYDSSKRYLWTNYLGAEASGGGTVLYITGDNTGNLISVAGDPNNSDDLIKIGDVDNVGNGQYLKIDGSVPDFTFVGGDVTIEEDLTVETDLAVDNDATFSGEVKGSKVLLCEGFYGRDTSSAQYLQDGGANVFTDKIGCIMPRAGSITDISTSFNCSSGSGAGRTVTMTVRVNGSSVFNTGAISCATTGDKSGYSSQARGTDTFSAGDVISIYLDNSFPAPTVKTIHVQVWGYFDE